MAARPSPPAPSLDLASLEASAARNPQDLDAALRLAWAYYGLGRFDRSEEAFERAHRLQADDLEPIFGLGLASKRQGKKSQAVQAFREAAERTSSVADGARASILRRLALGHVNHIERGEWDLEREVWGHA